MSDLRKYREKRDPERTPEPPGDKEGPLGRPRALPAGAARRFVVQQHAARSMHWDLRLEIDGVLVSWAVPRGPTLDPGERRLAVQTEDHPIEYATFEGVIPHGNYGAGAMIVWDRGSYHTPNGQNPREGLAAGKLDLVLEGHKLRGRFALVRTRGAPGSNARQPSWLLLHKTRDRPPHPPANPGEAELVDREPRSVLSGLTVEQVGDGISYTDTLGALADQAGAPMRRPAPAKTRPMLAATEEQPFSRDGWLFEIKYDGMRVLASKDRAGAVALYTRSGREVSGSYPEIARALAALPVDDFILDGEVAALGEDGTTSFERLQRRFSQTGAVAVARAEIEVPTILYAFDLLSAAGRDLRQLELHERKALLARFVPVLGQIRYADHVEEHGQALFDVAVENGLEGVIAKRASSRYETGRRSKSWLKIRVPHTALLAVVGWETGRGSRSRLGSLKLAWHKDGDLVHAGNVGSGLTEPMIDALIPVLESTRTEEPVCEGATAERGAHFVTPTMAAEVRYTEVTSGGQLRHPILLRLVPFSESSGAAEANPGGESITLARCVAPSEHDSQNDSQNDDEAMILEPPEPPPETTLQITRREKVFWPESGKTKGDLLDYYEAAWPFIAPYLRDRPVVLTRYPDGILGKHFFQQNAPKWTPDWVLRETIDGTDFFICNEKRTLLHVINSGAIPLHVFSARRTSIDRPDWIILDLDPKAAPFSDVVTIARHIHALLDETQTPHFVKTSGQAGLHILVPIEGALEHDDARALAEALAKVVVRDLPEIATVARPIASRGDKVYIDYLQNGRGKLIVAPFSVRPQPGAPVSMPLTWRQVTKRLDPARWNIDTAVKKVAKDGDPMRGLLDEVADVHALLDALISRG